MLVFQNKMSSIVRSLLTVSLFAFLTIFLYDAHLSAELKYYNSNKESNELRMEIGDHIAYAIIDYNSGEVLSSYNLTKKMYPASLTKLMTLFIVFDKIENNELSFDTMITVSKEAASQVPVKLGIPEGSKISVRDAILATIIKSHNDMAFALAEVVAGSEKEFIKLMNAKVKELGLTNTHFATVNGLHNKNQYTTVYDMVKLSRALMIKHNAFYTLFSVSSFDWNNTHYSSTNHLLGDNRVDGIKTGYTNASGFNLISSAQQNNTRIIAGVMGFRSAQNRDEYMKQIINDGLVYAKASRESSLHFLIKPKDIQTTDLTITHENYQMDKVQDDADYANQENYDSQTDSITSIVEKSVDNANDNNSPKIEKINYEAKEVKNLQTEVSIDTGYAIDKIDYLEDIVNADKVYIKPKVYKIPVIKGNYKIQVGAFSNYQSALREAYNIANIKVVSKLLPKSKVSVDKNSSYYIARFNNLDKATAYESCRLLKSKGSDCFVIKT